MMNFDVVVAVDKFYGIGFAGNMPWPRLPTDMRQFKELTMAVGNPKQQNAVIMGRKTWESLPEAYRPLPGRLNIVVSSTMVTDGLLTVVPSLDAALGEAAKARVENAYVIGGGQLYAEAVKHPDFEAAWVTFVDGTYTCDTFFPAPKTIQSHLMERGKHLVRFEREIELTGKDPVQLRFETWVVS